MHAVFTPRIECTYHACSIYTEDRVHLDHEQEEQQATAENRDDETAEAFLCVKKVHLNMWQRHSFKPTENCDLP